jgi:hypothetical protein
MLQRVIGLFKNRIGMAQRDGGVWDATYEHIQRQRVLDDAHLKDEVTHHHTD